MLELDELLACLATKDTRYLKVLLDRNPNWFKEGISDYGFEMDATLLHIISGYACPSRDKFLEFVLNRPQIAAIKPDYVNKQASQMDNSTAAHIASCWGYSITLRTLLRNGADPFIVDKDQLNVWDMAHIYDHHHCIMVLEQEMNEGKCESFDNNETIVYATEEEDEDNADEYSVVDIADEDSDTIVELSSRASLSDREVSFKRHVDKKFGVALLEMTRRVSRRADENDGNVIARGSASLDETVMNLDPDSLRKRLMAMGDSPGPITKSTEQFYRNRLQRLKRESIFILPSPGKSLPLPNYSDEINCLILGKLDFAECKRLEREFCALFEGQGPARKNYFTYLLLDPRITKNLPDAIMSSDYRRFDGQLFKRFTEAIFYVGKGQGNRPFMHLYEAALYDDNTPKRKCRKCPPNKKLKRVLEIWSQRLGVVSLHCFHTITSNEALARECLMIEALGLENLTNIQIGQNKSRELKWTMHKRQLLGTYLLYKVYNHSYLENGERQIRRCDLMK